MPLYRQEQDSGHAEGASRTTMANWIIRIAEEKQPVFSAMKAELLPVKSFMPMKQRTGVHEEGRRQKAVVCGYTNAKLMANTWRL